MREAGWPLQPCAVLRRLLAAQHEIELLWNRWKSASEGEGQVVFIVGEAGIGKSRLMRQFRERLAGTPHTWNECSGASYFQNTPFYPITDMLQHGFAQRGNESDEAKLGQLERDLELAGLKLPEAVPLVASMLNVPVGETYPPLTLSAEQKRKRLLATLAGWLFGAARAQPIVMAVEDLHWFDASTLELIQLLDRTGGEEPAAIVVHRATGVSGGMGAANASHALDPESIDRARCARARGTSSSYQGTVGGCS